MALAKTWTFGLGSFQGRIQRGRGRISHMPLPLTYHFKCCSFSNYFLNFPDEARPQTVLMVGLLPHWVVVSNADQ